MANFSVTRTSQSFVHPNQPTPHEALHLSSIDKVPGLRHLVRILHVFKYGHHPANVIKEALSKALVPYYPFAGRLVHDHQNELFIDCNNQGAWFAQATSSHTLKDVNYFEDHPTPIPQSDMFPDYVLSKEIDPLTVPCMFQVTEFACGGFVLATITIHTIADGLGSSQFFRAIGEFARGQDKPTVTPIWARHLIPDPQIFPDPGPEPELPTLQLKYRSFDVSVDYVNRVKNLYAEATGKYCSTFDVCTAKTWQSRVHAMDVHPETVVRVCFFASTRHLLSEEVNAGYYGNCFYPVTATGTAGDIVSWDMIEIVKIIREAKGRLAEDFGRWGRGEGEEDGYALKFEYETLFVSDWVGLGFMEEDFGWGKMMHLLPFAYTDFMAVAVFGTGIRGRKGVRVMTQCVGKEHLARFEENMEVMK